MTFLRSVAGVTLLDTEINEYIPTILNIRILRCTYVNKTPWLTRFKVAFTDVLQ